MRPPCQLALRLCQRPVCERPCLQHRVCPYELSRQRTAWRARWRRRKVFGPLDESESSWVETVEGYDPWHGHT